MRASIFSMIPRLGVPKNSFRSFTSMIPTDESSPHITARHTGPGLTKRISSSAARRKATDVNVDQGWAAL
jgi:hypothetical protein